MNGTERNMESTENISAAEDGEVSMIITFRKPYTFEGKQYEKLDLTGLEELTGEDMIAVNRIMSRTSHGSDVMPEVSLEYACNLAARAAKLPVEFFFRLPPREAMKVKSRVMAFLFGSE